MYRNIAVKWHKLTTILKLIGYHLNVLVTYLSGIPQLPFKCAQ